MSDLDLVTQLYGASAAPHLKAADHEGLNATVAIKAASLDEVTFPGQPVKKGIIIDIGKEKPIFLSRTNASVLCGHFGDDLGAWVGRKIILQTKPYNIEGKNTIGWVTIPMPENNGPDDDIPF